MRKNFLAIIMVITCFIGLVLPVAGVGLLASPAKFNLNLNPSQSVGGTVNVQNIGNSTLQVTVDKKREQSNGRVILFADDGIAQWISLNTTNLTLKPGETKSISFTVKAPSTINYRDAFGVLVIRGTPIVNPNTNSSGVSIITKQGVELLIPIIVGLPGPIVESINLLDHKVPWILLTYMSGDFNYHIKNNGTVMENVTADTHINGWFSKHNVTTSATIYPEDDYYLKNTWKPDIYDVGVYSVETDLTYGKYNGNQTVVQKDNLFVLPVWLIILILLAVTVWILRRENIKSPIVIRRREK